MSECERYRSFNKSFQLTVCIHRFFRLHHVKTMLLTRAFMWPILAASYAALIAALLHTLFGNWSGAALLGILFAVVIGAPSLAGYAGYLWRKPIC